MISILSRHWLSIRILLFVSFAVPLSITAYEMVFLGKESVNFLGTYPPIVGVGVLIYYALIMLIGVIWVVSQIQSVYQLRNDVRINELRHLQQQVNPHFFFNMLNNLYGMVGKDVEKSRALILKLSELMRYSIYDGEKGMVALEEEIAYMKNYLSLHSMRYHKTIDIQFNARYLDKKMPVLSLVFIVLLENAFKHGAENLRENAFVHLDLQEENGTINFSITNNYDPSELPAQPGIGLTNLRKRLAIAYPKKHTLVVNQEKEIYQVQLQLRS